MTVYIASRFRNKDKVRALSSQLTTAGFTCLHSWTEEVEGCSREEAARRDLAEIRMVDGLIVLTEECELVPGGMHFEAGYAYAAGKYIVVIGPRVNIFYDLFNTYGSVEEYLAALGRWITHES